MTSPAEPLVPGTLDVTADLVLTVDGQHARLTGSRSDLRLTASDPVALWRSAASVPWPTGITVGSGPRALGALAGVLGDAGVHLDVTGPQGRVAELGRGVDSALGGGLTGSRRVRFGSPRTLVATVGQEPVPWRPVLLVAAALVLARVLTRLRRR